MSTSYALTQLVFTFLFALVIPLFLFCKRKVLATEAFKTRYGALTDRMNSSNSSIRYYQMLFLLRRLAFSAIIVLLPRWPWSQAVLIFVQCFTQIVFVGYAKVFFESYQNKLDLANEYLVLLSCQFLFIYSDGLLMIETRDSTIKNVETQEQVGISHIALLLITISVNVAVMLTVQAVQIYRDARIFVLKRRHNKRMAEIQIRQEQRKLFMAPLQLEEPFQNTQSAGVATKNKSKQFNGTRRLKKRE